MSHRRYIYSEDVAIGKIKSYEKFKEQTNYYLQHLVNKQKVAFIKRTLIFFKDNILIIV